MFVDCHYDGVLVVLGQLLSLALVGSLYVRAISVDYMMKTRLISDSAVVRLPA
jgi:hypothetical protein